MSSSGGFTAREPPSPGERRRGVPGCPRCPNSEGLPCTAHRMPSAPNNRRGPPASPGGNARFVDPLRGSPLCGPCESRVRSPGLCCGTPIGVPDGRVRCRAVRGSGPVAAVPQPSGTAAALRGLFGSGHGPVPFPSGVRGWRARRCSRGSIWSPGAACLGPGRLDERAVRSRMRLLRWRRMYSRVSGPHLPARVCGPPTGDNRFEGWTRRHRRGRVNNLLHCLAHLVGKASGATRPRHGRWRL